MAIGVAIDCSTLWRSPLELKVFTRNRARLAVQTLLGLQLQIVRGGFDRAAPGTTVSIPINPDWQLVLIKH